MFVEFGNYEAYRSRFRKRDGNKTVNRKKVPKRLLVAQNITADAKMEGYLHKHSKTSGWKKLWVILSESVLYEVKAVKDPVAVETTPILGYVLEPEYQLVCIEYSCINVFDMYCIDRYPRRPYRSYQAKAKPFD